MIMTASYFKFFGSVETLEPDIVRWRQHPRDCQETNIGTSEETYRPRSDACNEACVVIAEPRTPASAKPEGLDCLRWSARSLVLGNKADGDL